MEDLSRLKPEVRVSLVNPASDSRSVFARGVMQLCVGVRELGSLNAAAKRMGMAYSKAWRIVKETEAAFGFKLLNRDGAHGSTLTPEGETLVGIYRDLSKLLQLDAQGHYAEMLRQLEDEAPQSPQQGPEPCQQHDAR